MEPTDPPAAGPRDVPAEARRAIKAIALGVLLGSVLAWLSRRRRRPEGR